MWIRARRFEATGIPIAAPSIGVLDDFVFLHGVIVRILNRVESAIDQAIVFCLGVGDFKREHTVLRVSNHAEAADY